MSREVHPFAQAMWDALEILGFDNDGDPTPAHCLSGMGDEGFIRMFLDDMREARKDYDDLLDELP